MCGQCGTDWRNEANFRAEAKATRPDRSEQVWTSPRVRHSASFAVVNHVYTVKRLRVQVYSSNEVRYAIAAWLVPARGDRLGARWSIAPRSDSSLATTRYCLREHLAQHAMTVFKYLCGTASEYDDSHAANRCSPNGSLYNFYFIVFHSLRTRRHEFYILCTLEERLISANQHHNYRKGREIGNSRIIRISKWIFPIERAFYCLVSNVEDAEKCSLISIICFTQQ